MKNLSFSIGPKWHVFFRGLPFGVKLLGAFRRSVKTGISRILTGRCTRGQGRDKKVPESGNFGSRRFFCVSGCFWWWSRVKCLPLISQSEPRSVPCRAPCPVSCTAYMRQGRRGQYAKTPVYFNTYLKPIWAIFHSIAQPVEHPTLFPRPLES